MRYFANPSTQMVRDAMVAGLIDCIDTPAQGNRRPLGVTWCADNGAFSNSFNESRWLAFLKMHAHESATCQFAVAPDVVGDAANTYLLSQKWLSVIRGLGYLAAYVAQDGQELFEPPWDEFDALFIGGTTDWKLGLCARKLAASAKQRGKWVHMGRVNSERRFKYAASIGCDSADGTYITFGPDVNLRSVLAWTRSNNQYSFDFS